MKFIFIATLEKIYFIQLENLLYIQADGKYTQLYDIHRKKYTSTKSMGEYEALLLSNGFYRIHHTYIINLKYLEGIVFKNTPCVELTNGVVLPISKRKYAAFLQHLGVK